MRSSVILALTGLLSLTAAKSKFLWLNRELSYIPLDTTRAVHSGDELFRKSCPEEFAGSRGSMVPRLLNSSYDSVHTQAFDRGQIYPSSSSFVRGVLEAWGRHQHLSLRPDEVWFEILAQLNYYMMKNADKVRHLFVNHEGKESISLRYGPAVTSDALIQTFASALQDRVKTDWLKDWVKPGFSTSSGEDDLTASIYMMGLMQNFFEFLGGSICGIPSVKLQGEKQDWVNLLGKLDHLEEFGEEPTEFARVLRPILQGFVQSWDEPNSPATLEFWSKIVLSSASHICGTKAEASGWITGFYFWNSDGDIVFTREKRDSMVAGSMLGDVKYIRVQVKLLPVSYAKVPLKLTDYPGLPGEHHVNLMAGNIGIYRTTNRAKNAVSAEPMSGWYMYGPVDPNRRLSSNSGNKDELASITTSFEECPASY